MEKKLCIFALTCYLLLCNFNLLQAQNTSTTQKAEPLADKNATTTQKPKINIAENNICKKCKCLFDYKTIDCRSLSLKTMFSSEEWETLQNGDVLFDTIIFNNNSISVVPVLPAYPVKNLYLSNNQINNISLGAFQNLDQLTKLDLSHNSITSKILKPHVFQGQYASNEYEPLKKMVELDLAYNQLHNLNNDLFMHLPNLETLILCKNQFQVIDPATTLVAIASLSSLKVLDMSYMELSDLPETIFHSPNELETLLLTGNLFHKIPVAFKFANNLKKLVLDENPLGDLEQGNFPTSLTSLKYLSISFLPDITRIGPYALSSLQNLTTLIAAENPKLSAIHRHAFTKNTTNPDIFEYPPLEEMFLNNNNLSILEHDWIERWQSVKTINLRFNPWQCDCANSWLIHSLMKQINTTNASMTRDVRCATPAEWKNKPLLELGTVFNELLCETSVHPEKNSLILVGILVGVLIGVPLTLASLVLYRRGCFGLRNRISPAAPRYNRASFADDFHI